MAASFWLSHTKQKSLLEALKILHRFFWGPDPASSKKIFQGTYLNPFKQLQPEVNYASPSTLEELEFFNEKFSDSDSLLAHLEEVYVRLFINNRGGIIAPLYASCYSESEKSGENAPLMGPPAVAMKKRFESKGLTLAHDVHEPPDHISIELEYLYYLLDKGWSDEQQALLSEASSFAGDVMLPWVSALKEKIDTEEECRFYPIITSILVSILLYLSRFKKGTKPTI